MAHTPPDALKVAFAGTPEFAARHLDALIDSQHQLVAVYTQPDRPAGRGKKLTASPVKQLAEKAQLPVYQPASLKGAEAQAELRALTPDIMVVVAYGLLLPQAVLDIPRLGCINVHASLLPRWRGAAPIQRAIEAGDATTGVTIMQMAAGLDTGDMLHKVSCAIEADDTAASLHDRLAEIGPPALLHTLNRIAVGDITAEVQDDTLSNYARKIDKSEAEINWQLDANTLNRQVHAFNPFPTAYTLVNNERLRVHFAQPAQKTSARAEPGTVLSVSPAGIEVQCGDGVLQITRLQMPGKRAMSAAEFINGFAGYLQPGQRLGGSA